MGRSRIRGSRRWLAAGPAGSAARCWPARCLPGRGWPGGAAGRCPRSCRTGCWPLQAVRIRPGAGYPRPACWRWAARRADRCGRRGGRSGRRSLGSQRRRGRPGSPGGHWPRRGSRPARPGCWDSRRCPACADSHPPGRCRYCCGPAPGQPPGRTGCPRRAHWPGKTTGWSAGRRQRTAGESRAAAGGPGPGSAPSRPAAHGGRRAARPGRPPAGRSAGRWLAGQLGAAGLVRGLLAAWCSAIARAVTGDAGPAWPPLMVPSG